MDGMQGADLLGRRVLVVEDEFFLAEDLVGALHGLGAEVVGPVPAAGEALTLISLDQRIDLAVIDLNLLGDTAFGVGDALLARSVPFVIATGYGREFLPARFRHLPYCEKPFSPNAVVRALCDLARPA